MRTNIVHAFAYYALNDGSLSSSAPRGRWPTALSAPLFWALRQARRKAFNEIFYRSYSGTSEDRLVVLAEELFEDVIKPNIYPGAQDLIDESRRAGCAGAGRPARSTSRCARLARYLGVDDLIANQLEFATNRDRQAEEAVRRRRDKADIMRDYCAKHEHGARRRAGPTPTASPTTRCSRSSATRPRATPTSGCARSRAPTTGRCSISTRATLSRCMPPASKVPEAAARRGSLRRHDRHRLRAAHHVLRRGLPVRGPARRHARHLPEPADAPVAQRARPRSATRSTTRRTCEPLHAMLRPGMKVTIAVDDISLPLPPMRTPDVRERVLEIVLRAARRLTASTTSTSSSRLAPPPHDRRRDPPHGRRQDLQRLLAGPLLQPRRRRPRRHGRRSARPSTARSSRSTAAPPRATWSST